MAENKFRDSDEWNFIRKWSWRAIGLWVIAGVAANVPNWIHTNITIPPVIKVSTAA